MRMELIVLCCGVVMWCVVWCDVVFGGDSDV